MASDRTTAAGSGPPHAPSKFAAFIGFIPLAALAIVLLDAATDFFPDDPLIGVVTPLRLVLALGLVALLIPGGGKSGDRLRARPRDFRTRLDLPIALLLFASVAVTYLGGHPTAPLRGLLTVIACYYLLVGLRRSRPESWQAVALLALVGVGAAGTAAFSQFTNETPTGFCRTGLLTDVSCDAGGSGVLIRTIGTFANPNLLAAFLVLLLPFVLLAAVTVDERSARTAVVLVGIVGYGALLTTFSRAGYVAAAAGLLVLAVAYWLAPRLADRAQRRLFAAFGLLALAAASAAIWAVSRAGDSLGVRGQAWDAALTLATGNPLGVGLGRSGAAISATAPGDRVFVHAHNLWLNWLVEAGPLGLLGILSVTVIAWASAARAARAKSVIGTVGLAALTGFFLMSMMDHPANLDRIDVLFWVVVGVVMAEAPAKWRGGSDPAVEPVTPTTVRANGPRHGTQPHRRPAPTPSPAPEAVDDTLPVRLVSPTSIHPPAVHPPSVRPSSR